MKWIGGGVEEAGDQEDGENNSDKLKNKSYLFIYGARE